MTPARFAAGKQGTTTKLSQFLYPLLIDHTFLLVAVFNTVSGIPHNVKVELTRSDEGLKIFQRRFGKHELWKAKLETRNFCNTSFSSRRALLSVRV